MRELQGSTREELQVEAIKNWKGKNTIILPTGVGKTKVACDIILTQQQDITKISKILIVVPNTNLVQQWERELLK